MAIEDVTGSMPEHLSFNEVYIANNQYVITSTVCNVYACEIGRFYRNFKQAL